MKNVKQGQLAVTASIVLLISAPVFANGLTEHTQEMSVDFSYTDVEDVQTDTNLSLGWSYIVEGGYIEIGGQLAYTEEDPEAGSSVDGTAIGPVFTFNFTPAREFSPYVSARVGTIGGDLGDAYDYVVAASFGVSFFVGDSAGRIAQKLTHPSLKN